MNVTKQPLEQSRVKLDITISEEEMQQYIQNTARKVSQNMTIKGFRNGEAPVDMVKKSMGEAQFDAELKNAALNDTYQQALQQENIEVLGQPEVDVEEQPYESGELTYSATVSVLPEFELPDYKDIARSVDYEEPEVTEDDIEQTKQQLLLSRASYTSKEEGAQEGDNLVVDFRVEKDGELLDQAEQYSIRLGDNQVIEDFEHQLYGLTAGEEQELSVTFPQDHHDKRLAGEQATFHVHVHDVQSVDMPEWNDELAETLTNGQMTSISEVEEQIKANVKSEKEEATQRDYRQRIMDAILEEIEVEVPEVLIERELDQIMSEMEQKASQSGDSLDGYLERQQKTRDELRSEMRGQAESRVKLMLTLRRIADAEELQVDDTQVEQRVESVLSQYGEEDKKNIDRNRLKLMVEGEIMDQQVIEWLAGLSVDASQEDDAEGTNEQEFA